MTAAAILSSLKKKARPTNVSVLSRFFKTGKGEYAEGDVMIGVSVPDQRIIAKQFRSLPLNEIAKLLKHRVHEVRLTGLFILVGHAEAARRKNDVKESARISDFYLKQVKGVNNWDLVDSSAPYILGPTLKDRNNAILTKLASSNNMWERRIAMIACQSLIRQGKCVEGIRIATKLLHDEEPLLHKAVGWMLREIGDRCGEATLRAFLEMHAKTMPRTALSYATEHLSKTWILHYRSK